MPETPKKETKRRRSLSPLRGTAIFLFLAIIGLLAAYGPLFGGTNGAIAKGVTISAIDVGGKTAEEARTALRQRIDGLKLTFKGGGAEAAVATVSKRTSDAPVSFNVDEAVIAASAVGRSANPVAAAVSRLAAAFVGTPIRLRYSLDAERLMEEIRSQIGPAVTAPRNARLIVRTNGSGDGYDITIDSEKNGLAIDQKAILRDVSQRLATLSSAPIAVRFTAERPAVTAADLAGAENEAKKALDRAPLALTAKGQTWTVSRDTIADWIMASSKNDGLRLALDREKTGNYLAVRGASLAVEPVDAVFEMKGDRVARFIPAVNGESIDVDGAIAALESALFSAAADGSKTVAVPMKTVEPEFTTEKSNSYGIKEIIGVGSSNFRGSPKNRIKNIGVGASLVNGVITPAGKEFSLLKTLGAIDESQGFVKELVIKNNKTTPEFGGGLCQIGTTTFRATLDSALPVTERQNHSYRVPYYERDGDGKTIGPGTDATIYDPAPDFRFMNDTGGAVMIMTDIKGTKLTFTFWGRKDGRTAVRSKVTVWDEVPPPQEKMIETADLKPGETKCTETPHAGGKAKFTYAVTYPNGDVKKKDFISFYKPWGKVCLIGVDPSKLPATAAASPPTDIQSADAAGATGN